MAILRGNAYYIACVTRSSPNSIPFAASVLLLHARVSPVPIGRLVAQIYARDWTHVWPFFEVFLKFYVKFPMLKQ